MSAGYYRYVYLNNYWIFTKVECNTEEISRCFEGADGAFKIIKYKAYLFPECDLSGDKCIQLTCKFTDNSECEENYCNIENIEIFQQNTTCVNQH